MIKDLGSVHALIGDLDSRLVKVETGSSTATPMEATFAPVAVPASTGAPVDAASKAQMDAVMKQLKDLEDLLNKKVDKTTFDNEIALLREMIGNMEPGDSKTPLASATAPAPSNNPFSSKDLALLKDLASRVGNTEETLQKLLNDMKTLNL